MLLASILRTQQPPVTVAQIRAEKLVRNKCRLQSHRHSSAIYQYINFFRHLFIVIGQRGITYSQQA